VGVLLDRQHDKSVIRFYPYAIFYPLVYWMLMAFITVITSPKALRKPRRAPATWHTERQAAPTTVAV
jgi:poly-beta-1,6-N-acetyl-D-glucosamine synthase